MTALLVTPEMECWRKRTALFLSYRLQLGNRLGGTVAVLRCSFRLVALNASLVIDRHWRRRVRLLDAEELRRTDDRYFDISPAYGRRLCRRHVLQPWRRRALHCDEIKRFHIRLLTKKMPPLLCALFTKVASKRK